MQYIDSGIDGRGKKVILWRTGEYTYELDIGGVSLKFYETEYYEALDYYNAAIMNYQESEEA